MRRSFVQVGLGFFVPVLIAFLGNGVPLDLAIAIVFGWFIYLMGVFPKIRVNWDGVATGVVCLVLIAIGSHLFLGWLYAQAREVKDSIDRRWPWRWTGWLVATVVLMFVAGLAAGGAAHQVGWLILSPGSLVSGWGSSMAAQRAQSTNNLKQIALGVYHYKEALGTFPPGATFDRRGCPLQSWQTMILPYNENKDLFDRIDVQIPWDDPLNAAAFRTKLPFSLNPGIPYSENAVGYTESAAGYALSHYAANVHVLGGDTPRAPKDVTDGESNTFMAGEVVSRFKPWGDPTNWRDPALGINKSPDGFGSPFPGGMNFSFVDGSVHFIKNTIDPKVLKALSTPKGGERISSDQY